MSREPSKRRPRTVVQNRTIWGLARKWSQATGLSTEDGRELVRTITADVSGQESTRKLTEAEAAQVIRRLDQTVRDVGGTPRPTAKPQQPPKRTKGRTTPGQQRLITALFEQLGWDDQRRRMGFCRRQCGHPWPQSQVHADQVIEGLKAMVMRQVDPGDIRQRVEGLVRDHADKLDAWQGVFLPDLLRQFNDAATLNVPLRTVLTPHKVLKVLEAELAVAGGTSG